MKVARYVCLVLACCLGSMAFGRAERALPRGGVSCAYQDSSNVEAELRTEEKCLASSMAL